MTIAIENIGAQTAMQMLKTSPYNRSLKESRIQKLITAIKNGEWHVEVTDVQIDINGELMGGHHILTAIVRTGITLACIVKRGVDPEVRRYTNECTASSPNDSWILSGHNPILNANKVWGAQKFIYEVRINSGDETLPRLSTHITNGERVKDMESKVETLEVMYQKVAKIAKTIIGYTSKTKPKLGHLAGIAGAMYLLRGPELDGIVESLMSGTIVAGSNVEHFRNYIRNTVSNGDVFLRGLMFVKFFYDEKNNKTGRKQAYRDSDITSGDNCKNFCKFAVTYLEKNKK